MSDFRERLQQAMEQELGDVTHRAYIPRSTQYGNLMVSVKDDYPVDSKGEPTWDWAAASKGRPLPDYWEPGQRVKAQHEPHWTHYEGVILEALDDHRLYRVLLDDGRTMHFYHTEILPPDHRWLWEEQSTVAEWRNRLLNGLAQHHPLVNGAPVL